MARLRGNLKVTLQSAWGRHKVVISALLPVAALVASFLAILVTPLFVEEFGLDENALMPLLSKPTSRISLSLSGGVIHHRRSENPEEIRKVLRDSKFPVFRERGGQGGGGGCEDTTTTILRGKSNDQHQCLLWMVDNRLFPLLLDFMHLLEDAEWLSRDVIFVYVNMSEPCVPSKATNDWLSSYHLDAARHHFQEMLDVLPTEAAPTASRRTLPDGGNIAAALVMSLNQQENESSESEAAGKDLLLSTVGGHGLFANLDLLTTFKMVQEAVGSSSLALRGMEECSDFSSDSKEKCATPKSLQEYMHSLACVSKFYRHHWRGNRRFEWMKFRDYSVDALELSISERFLSPAGKTSKERRRLMDVLELFTRALNNVEEKLHHSTYTYVLTSLSCGVPSFLLILLIPVFQFCMVL